MRFMFVAVLLALASVLEAQAGTREYALIYGRKITQDSLTKAIRECDRNVIRPPCADVVNVAQKYFPNFGKGQNQLADYIASLEKRECPSGAKIIATEWVPPRLSPDNKGILLVPAHSMECTSGEWMLWDKNTNKPVLSLYDGNFITSYVAPTVRIASATVPSQTTQAGKQSVAQRKPADTKPVVSGRTTSELRVSVSGKDKVSEPGPRGPEGPRGFQGPPGLSCWDLNGNGVADILTEDVNHDNVVSISDCRGAPGRQGPPGEIREHGHGWLKWAVPAALIVGGGVYCALECDFGKVEQKTDVGVKVNGFVPAGIRRGIGFSLRIP